MELNGVWSASFIPKGHVRVKKKGDDNIAVQVIYVKALSCFVTFHSDTRQAGDGLP